MKSSVLPILGLLTLTSCGFFHFWDQSPSEKERELAGVSVQHLMVDDELSFEEEINQKLSYIHQYYILAQKRLIDFDRSISETDVRDLYQSESYLGLLAIRTQIEDLEHDISEVWSLGDKDKASLKKRLQLSKAILKFAAENKLQASSMENLIFDLDLQGQAPVFPGLTNQDVVSEFRKLETLKEFQIFEKNIEHLSHVMETRMDEGSAEFKASAAKSGSINGHEFPSKVWSISFDDGPTKTTLEILKILKQKEISATFFQLTSRVEKNHEAAKSVLKNGMEVGSHSWNHLQLTKVGGTTLNKEIGEATLRIEQIQGKSVQFYRLPYGAGVSVNHIREKIAAQGLIHAGWNVDGLDWLPQSPDKIVARTIQLMGKTSKDAGIILLHDLHPRTSLALPAIIDFMKMNSRRVCTLEQIVSDMNEGSTSVCVKK